MSTNIDQAELAQRLKQKDKEALRILYDHYSGALYGTILRIVSDDNVAEEVLHDAFMKIWDRIDSYDSKKGRLFTWMLNVTRNLSIDKLRSKEIKQSKKTDDIADNVYNVDSTNLTYLRDDDIGVKDLLGHLREEERLIVDLVYFQGFTQAEVSDEKGIPLGTVKTRLRMAMKNLRDVVGNT